jgi:hypothetical protein
VNPVRAVDGQGGFVSIPFVAAAGLSLIVLTMVANLVVFQYAHGVVRAALDEGARAGSRAGATVADCLERATGVLDDLLSGELGTGVVVACDVRGDRVVATAEATFSGWLPGIPDWTVSLAATAVKESFP